MKAIDLVGRVFGRLQVVARAGSTDRARPLWRCRCACGNEPIVLAAYLLAGRTRSCGCLRVERARASIVEARAQRRQSRPRFAAAGLASSSMSPPPRHARAQLGAPRSKGAEFRVRGPAFAEAREKARAGGARLASLREADNR